jgi:hypothetical protein
VEGILRLKDGMTVNPVTPKPAATEDKAKPEEAGG